MEVSCLTGTFSTGNAMLADITKPKIPHQRQRASGNWENFNSSLAKMIDQSQFKDSIQFEQDSVTIEFRNSTQLQHTNIMFDEVSSKPSLQQVLTDVQVKAIGSNQSWLKQRFKINSGACGNLMPVSMYRVLYKWKPIANTVIHAVSLLDYNKQEIRQLGTCNVIARFGYTSKCNHFYVVSERLKPIIGVGDALALKLTSFHCPIYVLWHSTYDLTDSIDSI